MRIFYFAMLLLIINKGFALQQTLSFSDQNQYRTKVIIAAVGDLLLHYPLQRKASVRGFESLWSRILPFIQRADIAYVNLEGPMANGITRSGEERAIGDHWDDKVYSDYPLFNYHPSLASSLKKSGFDIVSTANNHALDRYGIGIDKTLSLLEHHQIRYTGTRKRGENRSFVTVTNGPIRIAWIACTEHTNGMVDKNKQVLYCYKSQDQAWILQSIRKLKHEVDAIIVLPHWGNEYDNYPTRAQKKFARKVLDNGALAVIGSHPHVLQPMEKYKTEDGRETFIMYSLGNFVSFQGTPNNRTSIILFLELVKTATQTLIRKIKFVPLYMENRSGWEQIHVSIQPQNAIISRLLPSGNMITQPP